MYFFAFEEKFDSLSNFNKKFREISTSWFLESGAKKKTRPGSRNSKFSARKNPHRCSSLFSISLAELLPKAILLQLFVTNVVR